MLRPEDRRQDATLGREPAPQFHRFPGQLRAGRSMPCKLRGLTPTTLRRVSSRNCDPGEAKQEPARRHKSTSERAGSSQALGNMTHPSRIEALTTPPQEHHRGHCCASSAIYKTSADTPLGRNVLGLFGHGRSSKHRHANRQLQARVFSPFLCDSWRKPSPAAGGRRDKVRLRRNTRAGRRGQRDQPPATREHLHPISAPILRPTGDIITHA